MESEEFEQIPWTSLVSQQDEGIDKRIYLAVGAVGILVIVFLGSRLLGGGAQPVPPQVSAFGPSPTSVVAEEVVVTSSTSSAIAEADLRANEPIEEIPADRLAEMTAEWFVTDWFTRDGSDETVRSIREALSPSVFVESLPHEMDGAVTFVEWAKTVESHVTPDGVEVTVAHRVIRETEDGFVRDPVRLVTIVLVRDGNDVRVARLPES